MIAVMNVSLKWSCFGSPFLPKCLGVLPTRSFLASRSNIVFHEVYRGIARYVHLIPNFIWHTHCDLKAQSTAWGYFMKDKLLFSTFLMAAFHVLMLLLVFAAMNNYR